MQEKKVTATFFAALLVGLLWTLPGQWSFGQAAAATKRASKPVAETRKVAASTGGGLDYLLHFDETERKYLGWLQQAKKEFGGDDPRTADLLEQLGDLYQLAGDFARAEPCYQRALEIFHKSSEPPAPPLFGPRKDNEPLYHPGYVNAMRKLAGVYLQLGQYNRAWPLLGQVLKITERQLGKTHPQYADALGYLAELHMHTGDYTRALVLYQQALEIRKAAGEPDREYAVCLHNLGLLYERTGQYERAEPLLKKDSRITKSIAGSEHPDYAHSLATLAFLYIRMERYSQAEPLLRRALELYRKTLGKEHPSCIRALNNLGYLYIFSGSYDRAEELLDEATRLRKKVLGAMHPDVADSLNDLATVCYAKRDYARAAETFREALRITRHFMDLTSTLQSERQQLAMTEKFRERLDLYLSLAARAGLSGDEVYPEVLAWKGAVFGRQQRLRLMRGNPQSVERFEALRRTAGQLATLALAGGAAGNREGWKKKVFELTEQKERLERDLSRDLADFRQDAKRRSRTPKQVQACLPDKLALVDFLEYTHWDFTKEKKVVKRGRLAAFLVRPGRPIKMMSLGAVEPIAEAIDRWRSAYGRPSMAKGFVAADRLRELVWQPLEPDLDGIETVLISPDGATARLPFGAISGRKPKSYLIERYSIVLLPVPQLLPELVASLHEKTAGEPLRASLLVLGEVDYGAAAGVTGQRSAGPLAAPGGQGRVLTEFPPLDFTRGEILSVRDSFELSHPEGRVRTLRRGLATEAAFRKLAPQCRVLHLATHGFFAPAKLQTAFSGVPSRQADANALLGPTEELFGPGGVARFHPGLLSGLALAGANRPATAGGDDGILTALEVAELDLRGVELAVLSACQTGLGKVAGGEGLLGLQRAFQVAGARSVMASLWKIHDDATRKLMERFYQNLWEKKMGKLQALREAQLWMMHEAGQRGLVVLKEGQPPIKDRPLPPYYWAPFVLSGDWR